MMPCSFCRVATEAGRRQQSEYGTYPTGAARFGRVLEKGRALRKLLLRQKQTEVALKGDPSMLIFLGKQELGQSNNPLQISSTNCEPVSLAFLDAVLEEKRRRGL